MGTLNSRFARRRLDDQLQFHRCAASGVVSIKARFWDVFRHFLLRGVSKSRHFVVACAVVGVALAGCAGVGTLSTGAPTEVKRDAVAARAQERWAALIKGDLTAAYAFLSPASKATMPLDLYKAKHKVGLYRAVKVDSVTCEGETCTVVLHLTYDYKRVKGMTTPLTEKWIIDQGQAWFVDRG